MTKREKVLILSAILVLAVSAVSVKAVRAGAFDSITQFFQDAFIPITPPGTLKEAPKEALYKPALDYEQAVIAAVDKAQQSVVSIVISKDVPLLENCAVDPFANLPPEFKGMFGDGLQFTQQCDNGATQKQDVGGGSGFVVSADGLIFTNKHVVADTKAEYTVFTNDGKKYTAKVLARDPVNDVAILKINAVGLVPATLGDSSTVKLGQTAIAIGNALGEYRNTVSVGVISGLARKVTAAGSLMGPETIQGVMQTDAAINPGNSGGPLLNLRGEVIGVNTAIASGAQNIGFAIPINQAKRAIESVKKTGSIQTPYLGVRYVLVNETIAKSQKLPVTAGALVRGTTDGPAVIPDSPAAKAGIVAEDIITAVNGEKITGDVTLSQLIQEYTIDETITLTVQRGDKVLKLPATLAVRPEQ